MSEKQSIKLKKVAEGEIHGPMYLSELVGLSCAAFVAPEDEISIEDGDWTPAHLVPELGMEWIIKTAENIEYGPTSPGTIREFLMVGEINEETLVYHKESKEKKKISDVLGESTVEQVKVEQELANKVVDDPEEKPEIEESMDVARDIRIHQLETDLKDMESKYNSLMLKFRKVTEELTTLKQG